MKLTKKILLAAVAVMAAFTFAGCDLLSGNKSLSDAFQKKVDEENILKYSDNSAVSKWNIQGENESTTDFVRALQFLTTKHSDMAGLARFDTTDAGVIGVLFNASREKDELDEKNNYIYSFGVAAVGKSSGNPYVYVSYFANVKETDLTKDNFGVTDKDKKAVDPTVKTPYEIVYLDITHIKDATKLANMMEETAEGDKNYAVVIDVDEAEDGAYTVNFYGKDVIGKNDTLKVTDATKPLVSAVTMSAESLGKTKAKQAQCGCYAMINKPGALNGSLSILDLTHEATPVEE